LPSSRGSLPDREPPLPRLLQALAALLLERTRNRALRHGAVDPGEFAAVLSALQDPSFSFVDALSVAAWGRLGRRAG
jgi:hypothetical protein